LSELTGHYLHAALNEVLYESLMAENRQRQAHMDRALQRLDDDCARLRLAYNTQRQEEITEEIEILLLAADMVADADRAR
jgi:F-type H+-transporting ATPase subunit gamma